MEADEIGSGLGKLRGIAVGVADHQVDVVKGIGNGFFKALEHRRADGDVGHEMAVHHIYVQKVGAVPDGLGAVALQIGKVRRKDRRGNVKHIFLLNDKCRA